MRIVGGTCRGRSLKTPKGREIRPTSDKVREALFDILGDLILERDFLDLFAGTGAVGIEAMSRGAATTVFVERDPSALALLRQNIHGCGLADRAEVIQGDVMRMPARLNRPGRDYSCIFVDPPYRFEDHDSLLRKLEEEGLVKEDTIVVLEHAAKKELNQPE